MPKVVYSPSKGLVQKAGSGFEITGDPSSTGGGGLHRYVREIDFGTGFTPSATDDGLICTVATLPDNALILRAYLLCTEVFSNNNTRLVDLSLTSAAATSDAGITASQTLIDGADLRSSVGGALGGVSAAVFSGNTAMSVTTGTETKLVLMNKNNGNDATALTTGKVLVVVEYIGTAGASDLNDVAIPSV